MATATTAQKDSHLRHAEYYDLTEVFDDLYARSKAQAVFTDLMPLILSEENIRLAYRNKQMRYMGTSAILPIGYCQTRNAQNKRKTVNKYTIEGRKEIHRNLRTNTDILHRLMRNPVLDRSIEYADNRISLYAAQYGKCAVTGWELEFDEIHCHHKLPVEQGGTDVYANLVIVHKDVHRLIHAKQQDTIDWYLKRLNLDSTMRKKLNRFRQMVGNAAI